MGKLRQSRTARPAPAGAVKPQERDQWIFESLGKMDCLTTSQIAALHFGGSVWAAQKRLLRLHRAGWVRAWVPERNLAMPNVYTLDRRGAALLGELTGQRWRAPQGLDGQLKHRLLINEIRIQIALALDPADGELVFWRSDRELGGRLREPVVPDALFAVRWPEGEQRYALEVERETRAPQRFLGKMLRYQAFSNLYGVGDLTVLVVAESDGWLTRYRAAIERAALDFPVLFGLAESVTTRPLDPVWTGIAGDERMSLRAPLCRKEGEPLRSA